MNIYIGMYFILIYVYSICMYVDINIYIYIYTCVFIGVYVYIYICDYICTSWTGVCVCLRYFNAYIGTMHVFNCMVLGLVKEAMECHGWLAEGQRVSLNAAIIWVSLASVGSNWWSRMCQT